VTEPEGVNYLAEWQAKRAGGEPLPNLRPPTASSGRPNYGAAILDGEVERVQGATKG